MEGWREGRVPTCKQAVAEAHLRHELPSAVAHEAHVLEVVSPYLPTGQFSAVTHTPADIK